jgi:starvation-inducible DNA-binding protein
MATTATKKATTKEVSVRSSSAADGRPSRARIASQLATPTDLTQEQTEAVANAVNPIIADSFALYVKTKNFHWHLSGPHFRDYHVLFDEQAEAIFGTIVVLAERVRKIGGVTIRSISHIGETQTISDDNDDFVPADQMIQRLLDDNKQVATNIRKAIDLTEEKGDSPTSNILQEILDETERRIWFLYEIAQ